MVTIETAPPARCTARHSARPSSRKVIALYSRFQITPTMVANSELQPERKTEIRMETAPTPNSGIKIFIPITILNTRIFIKNVV